MTAAPTTTAYHRLSNASHTVPGKAFSTGRWRNVTLLKPVFYSFSPIITINRFYIQACRNNLPPFTFAHPWMCFIFTEWITLCLNRWAVYWKMCISRCGMREPMLHGSTMPAEGSVWTRLRFLWGISAVWMFPAVAEGINRPPLSPPPVLAAPAAPAAAFPSGMGSCNGELLWLMFDCAVHLFICLANKWIINDLPPCFPLGVHYVSFGLLLCKCKWAGSLQNLGNGTNGTKAISTRRTLDLPE